MNQIDKVLENKYKNPSSWKNGFSMLPTSLLMDGRLSRSCLVVFWVLTLHLFRGKKYCFPSIELISKESHSSRPTVINAIKQLKQFGYLEVDGDKKSGKVNKYYLKVRKI